MAPKRVDRAARREDILDAAVRVFARRGYAATRIEDVAAEAGIAKGSVYLYFEGREALLAAGFERIAQRSAQVLADARSGDRPADEALAALVEGAVAMLAAEPDLTAVMLDLWSAGGAARRTGEAGPPPPAFDIAAVYREYRTLVAELLRRGGSEGALRPGLGEPEAAVVVAAIEGCLLQWLVDPSVDLARLAGPITATCLDGLRARPVG
ncbi:TetR/AcrR family transcriptional regulator [Streptomonospora wellingtoniae]|uniref:TetR/AcrR family transcriptional regulator n=1 Tax=Streptomonospora wellingtoniae TaxID=3075544 RepID=A0ABU2KNM1_9ACTN|nr:TetR/AcrR family transcriptional regulator [Streptomonospora sp. DSM 45055]MDT0300821.1 TetR/AcrR family transcriptional regulator [Streptomonospora sp. DSM 45055]